jgi:hypothetical protein
MTTRRRRSRYRQAERRLYLADRTLLDLQAAMRGPGPLTRGLIRRRVRRGVFRPLRRMGLSLAIASRSCPRSPSSN